MEKQQIIHNKWSDLGITLLVSQYDFDGWIDVNELEKEQITANLEYKKYGENDIGHETMLCRPKSLKGIENNNGWTVLNSEDDLPKTDKTFDLWFLTKTGHITINNWNSKFKHKTYGYLKVYSHFQIITHPNLPIY